MRRYSKETAIGNVKIGGKNAIAVQSMLSAPSYNTEKNINQAKALKAAGCNILRVAIPDKDAVKLIYEIKEKVGIALVADIHFDYKLALESVAAGIDKIRINPGNIGDYQKIKTVANACAQKNIPIRIGVNSGSIEKKILEKYLHPSPEAMCESALYNASILESFGFGNIVISLKSSSVETTVKAYQMIAQKCNYPLHLGVTETGTREMGTIKSAIGIGSLLLSGIGDTLRVSLTDDPVNEVITGINILKALGLYENFITFISCPTCGRTRIDVINIAKEVESLLKNKKINLKVAVMGCPVNGPGEAKEADIGVAGANGKGVIFKKGKVLRTINEKDLVSELVKEVNLMANITTVETTEEDEH